MTRDTGGALQIRAIKKIVGQTIPGFSDAVSVNQDY